MANIEQVFDSVDIHPIDIVESLAASQHWDFDRIAENQIAMVIEGQWRTYSITLAWFPHDETLRMLCSFDMDPPAERLPVLYDTLNLANGNCWTGAFSFWEEQKIMVYRYGLVLAGGEMAGAEQISHLVERAVRNSERYYPAFQLVCWSDETPQQALLIAMDDAYGTA